MAEMSSMWLHMATNRSKNLGGENRLALVCLNNNMHEEGKKISKDVHFPTSFHLHLHCSTSFEGRPTTYDQSQIMSS